MSKSRTITVVDQSFTSKYLASYRMTQIAYPGRTTIAVKVEYRRTAKCNVFVFASHRRDSETTWSLKIEQDTAIRLIGESSDIFWLAAWLWVKEFVNNPGSEEGYLTDREPELIVSGRDFESQTFIFAL